VAALLRLEEAVRELVHDGGSVAHEGFTEPSSEEELRVLRRLKSALEEATA
jgi:hypothetical protein